MLGSYSNRTENPLVDFSFLYSTAREKTCKNQAGPFQHSLEAGIVPAGVWPKTPSILAAPFTSNTASEEPLEAYEEEYMRWLIGSSIDEESSPLDDLSAISFSHGPNASVPISSMVGRFVDLSTDQRGSRFLQQRLEMATIAEKEMVFREILPSALSLMVHIFGNYVVQKFLDKGTTEQRDLLADAMKAHFLSLSLHTYGCRVVQKALEVISLERRVGLVVELKGGVSRCIMDQNGNHVLQKIIERVPSDLIGFVFDTFVGNTYGLATHPYGCRVTQRIIEYCHSARRDILAELLVHTGTLVQDQYGNYVVQHVLEHGGSKDRAEVISHLKSKIFQLSRHKFASNVIEKCLQYGGYEERQILINEILDDNTFGFGGALIILMQDQYANFIIQRMIKVCSGSQRKRIVHLIKSQTALLKKSIYGRHVIAQLEKVVGKLSQ
eukprot:TRINITY_DN8064_c0_g1_i1.p1 TRINITY_DN8064_c0_g1~~TRINITY_DN8064_c0_g1_i1.p1  ORF type:complete len:451 (-),score=72.50 TRINITY_DN8064_c0_g1_i1:102-1418(-)